jgi:hypothetical protein
MRGGRDMIEGKKAAEKRYRQYCNIFFNNDLGIRFGAALRCKVPRVPRAVVK